MQQNVERRPGAAGPWPRPTTPDSSPNPTPDPRPLLLHFNPFQKYTMPIPNPSSSLGHRATLDMCIVNYLLLHNAFVKGSSFFNDQSQLKVG